MYGWILGTNYEGSWTIRDASKHQNDTILTVNNSIRLIRTIWKSCTYFRFWFKKKKVLKENTLRENVYVKVKEPNSGRFLSGYVVWSCMYYFLFVPTTTVDETMEQYTLSWNRKQILDHFSLSDTYKITLSWWMITSVMVLAFNLFCGFSTEHFIYSVVIDY